MKTLTLVLVVLLCCGAVAQAQEYDFYDLGTLGGSLSQAYAVNDAGQVVGWSMINSNPNQAQAFLWDTDSGLVNLGTAMGVSFSSAYGISESGQIAGEAYFGGSAPHAFYWDGSSITNLQTLGGARSYAYGVNDAGQVVGKAQASSGDYQPFYWDTGLSGMQPLQNATGRAQAINNAGQVTGSFETAAGEAGGFDRAFVWDNTNGVQILQPSEAEKETFAQAINGQGSIAGYSEAAGGQYQAFLWDTIDQVRYDLGAGSQGFGLNDLNVVVGEFDTASGKHAFLHQGNGFIDLNTFLPDGSGWVLQSAQDINNNGVIVGWGMVGGQTRAFVLAPKVVPEPLSMLLFVVGGGALAASRKLRKRR